MKPKNYIKRDIESALKKYVQQFPVVALTGPRQAGKSTVLSKAFSTEYKYISVESPDLRERILNDPNLFLDTLPEKVIFDEIQYLPELIPYIKIRVDNNRSLKGQFIITGSHQFLLMKHLTESLAGRVGLLNLLPVSVNELARYYSPQKINTLDIFSTASFRGLYPELTVENTFDHIDWYSSYIQTYLEKDIRTVQNIGNLRDFHRFLTLLAGRCSQILNMSSFAKEIGVSVPTIKQWVSILEASYIIYLLPPYFSNRGKSVIKSPKVYFTDTGIVSYLIGLRTKEQILQSPYAGALFENFCLQEFLKDRYHKNKQNSLYYWRTKNGTEIDLIIEEGMNISLYEFKFSKTIKPSMASGIESFLTSCENRTVKNIELISLVDESFKISKNVIVENIVNSLSNL